MSLPVRLFKEAAIVLLFLALAALGTWPLVTDLRDQMLGGRDPLIDLWTVHWLSTHLFEPGQVFAGNIFHPAPHAVLRNALSVDTALLLVPFRPFVADPVPLYNLGLLLTIAFGGWAFHALARALTGNVWAGLLAGILAGYGSHQMSHVFHLNRVSIGGLALFLLGLHRLARRPGTASVALAGAGFAVCAVSSGYYGAAALVLGLAFVGFYWRSFRSGAVLGSAAAAAVLALVLVAPYARAFLDLRGQEGMRRALEPSEHLAFHPTRDLGSRSYVYSALPGSQGQHLFPGLLTLFLAGVALKQRRDGGAFYLGATALLLLFSLGPTLDLGRFRLPLPYRWLFAVPPLDAMRHPYTFAAVATFTLSVLAAIGFAGLRGASRAWAGPAVVVLAVLETLGPPRELRLTPSGLPPAYALLDRLPPGPLLEIPVYEPYTLLWAARHGRPVVNGANAFVPPRTALLELVMRYQWLRRPPENVDDTEPTRLLLEEFGVRYVIVPSGRRPQLRALAAAFDRSRTFAIAAQASDGDRIYEVRRSGANPPSPGTGTSGRNSSRAASAGR